MALNVVQKILKEHLVEGELIAGAEIGIRIDQTLTQDATGTTCFLLFESMGLDRVRAKLAVSYVDHNMSQMGPENHNDHLYLQTVSRKVGAWHSRPGNGICHQVNLERFSRPGWTLLGSDSHTPTAGGVGMAAIGAGGLDVAVAMAGGTFYLTCPKVIGVNLKGSLKPWVSSKDIILKLLSILTTKGNVGCAVEYFGQGVKSLSVPARATCTNMGAELGVTFSIFPSDQVTKKFLSAQNREDQWVELQPDEGASYDRVIDIDLSTLEPMVSGPGSPDNILSVKELAGKTVHQVIIGSCTNSSFQDLMICAKALEGRTAAEGVELAIAPGSKQVLEMISANGALATFIKSGARILESGCGPCIGQGFSPADNVISVRSFNRNFTGRTGTKNDQAYLASPEVCIASAITGKFSDPRDLSEKLNIPYPTIDWPEKFIINDNMLQPPLSPEEAKKAVVARAPSIVTPPLSETPPETIRGEVLIKLGDKISTDIIMPAGSFLKYRSNVPEYSKVVFTPCNEPGNPTFAERALKVKSEGRHGIVVAAESYGQGSSREHAALCPMYLGVKVVLAKSIERIHYSNLINFGIVPITFENPADYNQIEQSDSLEITGLLSAIRKGETKITIKNLAKKSEFCGIISLSSRQRNLLLAGGLLPFVSFCHSREGGNPDSGSSGQAG
jgi:aconitate hydratase